MLTATQNWTSISKQTARRTCEPAFPCETATTNLVTRQAEVVPLDD